MIMKDNKEQCGNDSKQIKIMPGKLGRGILLVLGTIFVGLGILGIILPVLPTTPFLLLASACYAKSSEKFYNWLINNKWFGEYIKNYQEGRGIPFKVKIINIVILWVTIIISIIFIIQNLYINIILIVIASFVTIHILSIKTLKQ